MNKIYCDFCKKEKDTFKVLDWDLREFQLDLCKKCHSELCKIIKEKIKEKK